MDSSSHRSSILYSPAIDRVIAAGEQLIHWLSNDQEDRVYAFNRLSEMVEDLHRQTEKLNQGSSTPDDLFFRAAIDIQSGYLLIEARHAVESGNKTGMALALSNLVAEQKVNAGEPIMDLGFEDYLMRPPRESKNDANALDDFKERAERTLDNMVTEAKEVISRAIKELKNDFDKFYQALGKFMNVIFEGQERAAIVAGLKNVVDSLNRMTELLKHEGIHQIIVSLQEMVHGLNLESLVAKAFAVNDTKIAIGEVKLGPTVNQATLMIAGARMAELSRQYVLQLKRISRVLTVVGAVGGMLLLTGVATHYVGPALPVVYALLALTTILIGMHFADGQMRGLISSL